MENLINKRTQPVMFQQYQSNASANSAGSQIQDEIQ